MSAGTDAFSWFSEEENSRNSIFRQGMASLGLRTKNKRGPWLALMGFSGLKLGSQKDTRATQKMTRHFLGNQGIERARCEHKKL